MKTKIDFTLLSVSEESFILVSSFDKKRMVNQNKVLSKLLKEIANENEIKNSKITVSDVTRGGYRGDPNRILIEEIENGKKSYEVLHLFMKSAPKGEASREMMSVRQIYLTEIHMYTEVFPKFLKFQEGKAVEEPFRSYAKCFKCSKEENNEFLIFEDLAKSGYVLWDKTKPMSSENVEFVLKQTAKFHAISFAVQDQRPDVFRELSQALDPKVMADLLSSTFNLNALRLSCEQALRCFDPIAEEIAYNKFKDLAEHDLETIVSQLANTDEVVIIHGDSWCNNFMFKMAKHENSDIVKDMTFLDWQFSRASSPVIDLSYFLYCNGPQEVLDNLDYYQQIYHDTLSSFLKEMGTDVEIVFPLSSLKNHWKKYARLGLVMACVILSISYNPCHAEAPDIVSMMEDGKDISSLYMSNLQNNEEYRKRIRGVIYNFVNNGFI